MPAPCPAEVRHPPPEVKGEVGVSVVLVVVNPVGAGVTFVHDRLCVRPEVVLPIIRVVAPDRARLARGVWLVIGAGSSRGAAIACHPWGGSPVRDRACHWGVVSRGHGWRG